MFKSLRDFTLDKPVDRKRLKIRHTREGLGLACTIVQLWQTNVVHRVNINNIVTLNSGGWRTQSTKITMNTALKAIYGNDAPYLYQSKGDWYLEFKHGVKKKYFDGMVIDGDSGIPMVVLN
jgi:hypothetical protein